MIAKNTCAIAIATLSGWLKDLEAVFQPMISKNQNQSHLYTYTWFFPRFKQVIDGF